uniref:S1 RNA-binding domain-containing protein n=1 Tax=Neisseria weixii TaxID=1853276 RepID=UPI0035A1809F
LHIKASDLIGNREKIKQIKPAAYTTEQFGPPTIMDILPELEKPGRAPRGEFQTATFAEGINEISDLQAGMILEGVVSNVANFGAFVDIGVHQDGLVHISALADKFVQDPREIVKAGDVVKVKVLEIDAARKRIALTMRLNDDANNGPAKNGRPSEKGSGNRSGSLKDKGQREKTVGNTAMADAFARLKR